MKIMVVARFIRLIFSVLLYCIYKIICKVLGHCCARSGDSGLSQEACFDCSISVLKKKKKWKQVQILSLFPLLKFSLFYGFDIFCLVLTLVLLLWFTFFACFQL